MKRILIVFLVLGVLLGLNACGSSSKSPAKAETFDENAFSTTHPKDEINNLMESYKTIITSQFDDETRTILSVTLYYDAERAAIYQVFHYRLQYESMEKSTKNHYGLWDETYDIYENYDKSLKIAFANYKDDISILGTIVKCGYEDNIILGFENSICVRNAFSK